MLAQAELDGKPARLNVAPCAGRTAGARATARPRAGATGRGVLYVSGKGRHKLELAVRLKLGRQGGWRVAEGMLPAAPATALTITVPRPQTELRLGQLADRRSYGTAASEHDQHGLGRRRRAEHPVAAQGGRGPGRSHADGRIARVLDVQEDGLRLVWQLGLEFRRSQREQFQVNLPADFLVEKVEGDNVRGWEIRTTGAGNGRDHAVAAGQGPRAVHAAWRPGTVGKAVSQFDVPLVAVTDAALHNGQFGSAAARCWSCGR